MRRRVRLPRRSTRVAIVLLVLVLGTWGVRSASPTALPTSGLTGGGWSLRIEFANALNLPDQAQVRLDGRRIGTMKSVRLETDRAVADLAVTEPATIRADTTGELRQDTLLGDMYIALRSKQGSTASNLQSGSTIPLAQTRPADQVEDLMTSASGFLGSGGVAQLGNTVQRLDNAFPDDPAVTRKITENLTATITAWAQNTQSLDTALRSVAGITGHINDDRASLSQYLSPDGLTRWRTIAETARVAEVFAALAPTFANTAPLVPAVRDMGTLFTQVVSPLLMLQRPVGASRPDNLINLRNLLRDSIIPWLDSGARVNIVRLSDGSALPTEERAQQAVKAMRMIGAVR